MLTLRQAGYGHRLKPVTCQFAPGQFVGIVGGNGAGKSTLAQLIAGALLPDSGEVRLGEWHTHIPDDLRAIRRRVVLVRADPETQIVTPTVREEIAFGLRVQGLSLDEIGTRVEEAIRQFDLERFSDTHPFALSTGELSRVVLAAQVVRRPHYLVLDEFTHMLDSITRVEMLRWLHRYRRATDTTVLMITHHFEELLNADRVLVLVDGHLTADEDAATILQRSAAHPEWRIDLPAFVQLALENGDPRLSFWRDDDDAN